MTASPCACCTSDLSSEQGWCNLLEDTRLVRRVCRTTPVRTLWWGSHRPSRVSCGACCKDLGGKLYWNSHPQSTPSSSLPLSFPHPPPTLIRALSPSRISLRCRQCRTPHPPCRESARGPLSLQTPSPPTALLPGHQSNNLPWHFWEGGGFPEIL